MAVCYPPKHIQDSRSPYLHYQSMSVLVEEMVWHNLTLHYSLNQCGLHTRAVNYRIGLSSSKLLLNIFPFYFNNFYTGCPQIDCIDIQIQGIRS